MRFEFNANLISFEQSFRLELFGKRSLRVDFRRAVGWVILCESRLLTNMIPLSTRQYQNTYVDFS